MDGHQGLDGAELHADLLFLHRSNQVMIINHDTITAV
jgi:hypothetical protein